MKKICKHCEIEFEPEPDNPGQEYCTKECWRKQHGRQEAS